MDPIAPATPLDLRERQRRHARVWVRSTTLIISTASLVVAILEMIQFAWYFNAIMSIAVFAAAVAWEIADLITYCVNKRGIHPGAHVGVELILWLAMIVCTILWGINGAYWDTYDYISGSYSFTHNQIAIAAVTTEALSTIFHFTLFVWACVDTDRRRKMRYADMAAMANQARMSVAAATMAGNTPYNYPPPPPGMAYQLVTAPLPNGQQPQAQGGVQPNTRYSQTTSQVFQQHDQRSSNGSPLQQQRVQSFQSSQAPIQPHVYPSQHGQQYAPPQYSNISEIDQGVRTPTVIEMSAKRD